MQDPHKLGDGQWFDELKVEAAEMFGKSVCDLWTSAISVCERAT